MNRIMRDLGVRWEFGDCVLCGERRSLVGVKMWEKKVNEGEFEKIKVCEGCYDEERMFFMVNWSERIGGDKRDEDLELKGIFKGDIERWVRYCKIKVKCMNKKVLGWNEGKLGFYDKVFWEKVYDRVRKEGIEDKFEFVGEKEVKVCKRGRIFVYWKVVEIIEEWEELWVEKSDSWGSGSGGRVLISGLENDEEEVYYGRGLCGSESRSEDDIDWKGEEERERVRRFLSERESK